MTYRELNKFKMSVYRDFIKQKYGDKELKSLDSKINSDITNKILSIQDEKQFIDEITELRESREKCENCKG